MFFSLARQVGSGDRQIDAETILALDAPTISFLMEAAWARGGPGLLPGLPRPRPAPIGVNFPVFQVGRAWSVVWDHLIYAYMIENTRIYDIFGRVIWEYAHGERLGIPARSATFQWLRTTEELFYKDASPFQPFNLVSRLRPDVAATRRNAYYRVFGMDLNHGRDGAASYPYVKPDAANREFVSTFEDFLRQSWVSISNRNNGIGPNPTDISALIDLATNLQNMLIGRRGGSATRPNLAREEALAVDLAAWLHLTVSFNTPVVVDLVASGASPEERLRQIGERVGIPAHGRAHSYFLIAPLVSTILRALELGLFSNAGGAQNIANAPTTRRIVWDTIHHWSLISGRDLRAAPTSLTRPTPISRTPMAAATTGPTAAVTAGGNGRVPVGST
jgi:hypothetical protein